MSIGRYGRTGFGRIFSVNGVKLSVHRIIWIEGEGNQPAGIAGIIVKLRKDFLEVDVSAECLGRFVDDVQVAIEIAHEKSRSRRWRCARLGPQKIHPA